MKSFFIALLATVALTACQKKEELPTPQAPKSEGNLATAPVNYLSAAARAQQSMVKTIDTTALNNAIELFNAQEGRAPADLNELVTKKYLPKLPAPPFGMKLQYDAKAGKASVVKE